MGSTQIFLCLTVAYLCVCPSTSQTDRFPEVTIADGVVRGQYIQSYKGQKVKSFTAIPYAKPPIGQHRFKESIPVGPWTGVYNATAEPNMCLQYTHLGYDVQGSEDCLYLSVYTPKLPSELPGNKLMDVIVFIHGGAFMFFSSKYYKGEYLMDKDFVVVTFNYRLGPLGFFSTGDNVVPGNNGLKDQNLALKWIQKNIAAFGGDPRKVTITGMSAGGASVHYHMLSPLSRGLFSKAASFSGSALCPWAYTENVPQRSMEIAERMGCPINDTMLTVRCLRNRPAEEIVDQSKYFMEWKYNPFSPLGPTVEPADPKAFLSEAPIDIIRSGKAADVPYLVTYDLHEGLYPAAEFLHLDDVMEDLSKNINRVLPYMLDYYSTVDPTKISTYTQQILQEYLKGKLITQGKNEFVQMLSDRLFDYPLSETAKEHAEVYTSKVYSYKFMYRGKTSLSDWYTKDSSINLGVMHGDQVGYMFDTVCPKPEIDSEDIKMKAVMIDMIHQFATTGVPGFPSNSVWTPVNEGLPKFTYLQIKSLDPSQNTIASTDNEGNAKFWSSLTFEENIPLPVVQSPKEEL